jgi:hypothetical protein
MLAEIADRHRTRQPTVGHYHCGYLTTQWAGADQRADRVVRRGAVAGRDGQGHLGSVSFPSKLTIGPQPVRDYLTSQNDDPGGRP